ncbi:MAG: IS200/IS605 family transposase [Chloroflexota bacterium]|nr:IS200/IS605 family transposase [Chloroflexota bacterium]
MLYHVWFSPTRRKWLLVGAIDQAIKEFLVEEACRKAIKVHAYETVVDHVHLLLELDEGQDMSRTIRLLKGYSARRVFQRFPELRMDAGIEHFWQRSYGCSEVPPSQLAQVAAYIRTQWHRLEKYDIDRAPR